MDRPPGDLDGDGLLSDADIALLPAPPFWKRLGLHGPRILWRFFTRNAKRFLVLVVGVAVLVAGVLMLVLPGPGVLIIIVGLAILATEFAWAERALDRTTSRASKAMVTVQGSAAGRGLLAASGVGLIVAGVLVPIVLGTGITLGASLGVAGLIGLSTLTPPVQRWLERQQAGG
jgi:uncharacterized protein (TIGR02611 family)